VSRYQIINQDFSSEADCVEMASGTVCWTSECSPEKETGNEDSILIGQRDDGAIILAIADGVGGQPGGAGASHQTLQTLASEVIESDGEDATADMINAIDRANKAIINRQSGAATTLAAVIIDNRQLRNFHIGDSEILVCGQRGRIRLQTIPHSPTGYAVESGMLSEDEALQHEDRHFVSNLVGSTDMRIELGSVIRMADFDTLLLCSDGVTDNLLADEIVELIRKGPVKQAANKLLAAVRKKMATDEGKPDDCSFILYRNRKTGC